jgi:CRISPR-associated protein Cas1
MEAAPPDYLPARMLNEYVYCPRLFYYEWVEGVFAHSVDTVAGSFRHKKLERKDDALKPAEEAEARERIHSRSVTLSSEQHKLIAKMDLIEGEGKHVVPVDYKVGSPREDAGGGPPTAWDTDRVQLAVQGIILRDNGYICAEGVLYYVATKQRVRVAIDDELVRFTLEALAAARATAAAGQLPLPLVDSPKCPRCSLVGICLPDETRACVEVRPAGFRQGYLFDDFEGTGDRGQGAGGSGSVPDPLSPVPSNAPIRRLVPARDDLRPLYLNTQGLYVGKTGAVLRIKDKKKVVQEVRMNEISQLNLFGNIQLTTQTVQALCEAEIPIAYFSQGGWFYGLTQGLGLTNIFLRREQFRLAEAPWYCMKLARALTAGKIRNCRVLLQRNHVEPPAGALSLLKALADQSETATSLEELLGIEGSAARVYFQNFAGMLKAGEPEDADTGSQREPDAAPSVEADFKSAATVPDRQGKDSTSAAAANVPVGGNRNGAARARGLEGFQFEQRNRRPPRDPINALLSLAYSLLSKDLTIICHTVGFDPFLGYYHQPRFGRPALALDLMEPFRPLIADSAVLSAVNTRMVTPRDFIATGEAVALKPEGRRAFYRAYEQRMDTLVTHPLFGYRVNYRRILEIQTRLLARFLTGELGQYPVFVTR